MGTSFASSIVEQFGKPLLTHPDPNDKVLVAISAIAQEQSRGYPCSMSAALVRGEYWMTYGMMGHNHRSFRDRGYKRRRLFEEKRAVMDSAKPPLGPEQGTPSDEELISKLTIGEAIMMCGAAPAREQLTDFHSSQSDF